MPAFTSQRNVIIKFLSRHWSIKVTVVLSDLAKRNCGFDSRMIQCRQHPTIVATVLQKWLAARAQKQYCEEPQIFDMLGTTSESDEIFRLKHLFLRN